MEKIVVFEINTNSISVMVGLQNKKQVAITFSLSREYSNLVRNGQFVNKEYVINELNSIYSVVLRECFPNDRNEPNNIIVTISSSTLSCHNDSEKYSVISTDRIYREIDLKHFRISLKNKVNDPTVNVLDLEFKKVLNSDDEPMDLFKFEQSTSIITANYNYYTINRDEFAQIKDVFDKSSIKVQTYILSKVALVRYLRRTKQYPRDYVLIDINFDRTEITLIENGFAEYNYNIRFGVGDLFARVKEQFNVSTEVARNLVYNFGLDSRKYLYPLVIYNGKNEAGEDIKILQKDLNVLIKDFFNEFISKISEASANLLQANNSTHQDIPFLFLGDLINIPGFTSGLNNGNESQILFYKSKNPCALKQSEADLLAAISLSRFYLYLDDIESKNETSQFRPITRGE